MLGFAVVGLFTMTLFGAPSALACAVPITLLGMLLLCYFDLRHDAFRGGGHTPHHLHRNAALAD